MGPAAAAVVVLFAVACAACQPDLCGATCVKLERCHLEAPQLRCADVTDPENHDSDVHWTQTGGVRCAGDPPGACVRCLMSSRCYELRENACRNECGALRDERPAGRTGS